MMVSKAKFLVICFLFSSVYAMAQRQHWYEDKPNTREDTLAIIKNHVKSLISFYPKGKDCGTFYPSGYYKVTFYYTTDKIDSVKFSASHFLPHGMIRKQGDGKLVEEITGEQNIQRLHYLDMNGQVVETKNKVTEGNAYEGENFLKIVYLYKDGLLSEAHTYYSKKEYCLVKTYSYLYY